jgi:hypothetical protein
MSDTYPRARRITETETVHMPAEPVTAAHLLPNETWSNYVKLAQIGQPRAGGQVAPPPVPPWPSAPTVAAVEFDPDEPALRDTLAARIATRSAAAEAAEAAEQAHLRGEANLSRCQKAFAGFLTLDAEVAEATATALRTGDGRPRIDQEDLRTKVAARDLARSELAAAEGALTVLLRSRGQAITDLQQASAQVDQTTAMILAVHAERLAVRHATLAVEAAAILELLMSAAHGIAGVRLGEVTRTALARVDQMALARPRDARDWERLGTLIKQDPQAELTLGIA